jgi:hypothetical protein
MSAKHVILTPINLTSRNASLTELGKKARSDYEKEKTPENKIIKWDDSKNNDSKIGDYFAFVRQTENIVEIYEIRNIMKPETRPAHWNIPDHQRRNVLILSEMIKIISWDNLKLELNYSNNFKLRGTIRSKNKII